MSETEIIEYRPKVLFGVPNTGSLRQEVLPPIIRITQDPRCAVELCLMQGKPAEHVRHLMVERFLEGDYEWLLMMDSDNPPHRNPLDLIQEGLPIVGCPTPIWNSKLLESGRLPITWNVLRWDEALQSHTEWPDPNGLQRVDVVGFGCILVARSVLMHRAMKAPFMRAYAKNGTVKYGDDVNFCRRARKAGFPIHAHFDYTCAHLTTVDLFTALTVMHSDIRIEGAPTDGKNPLEYSTYRNGTSRTESEFAALQG